MRVWLRRIQALVSSAVFAPVLAKLGAATLFLTVLGLVGRGVFDPFGLSPSSARAASALPTALPVSFASSVSSAPPVTSASAAPVAPPVVATCATGTADGAPRVILNLAAEADLVKVPGVGPKKAQAILALRDKVKKFKRIEELYRVRGIKRRFVDRVRPHLVLDATDCDRPADATSHGR